MSRLKRWPAGLAGVQLFLRLTVRCTLEHRQTRSSYFPYWYLEAGFISAVGRQIKYSATRRDQTSALGQDSIALLLRTRRTAAEGSSVYTQDFSKYHCLSPRNRFCNDQHGRANA